MSINSKILWRKIDIILGMHTTSSKTSRIVRQKQAFGFGMSPKMDKLFPKSHHHHHHLLLIFEAYQLQELVASIIICL